MKIKGVRGCCINRTTKEIASYGWDERGQYWRVVVRVTCAVCGDTRQQVEYWADEPTTDKGA